MSSSSSSFLLLRHRANVLSTFRHRSSRGRLLQNKHVAALMAGDSMACRPDETTRIMPSLRHRSCSSTISSTRLFSTMSPVPRGSVEDTDDHHPDELNELVPPQLLDDGAQEQFNKGALLQRAPHLQHHSIPQQPQKHYPALDWARNFGKRSSKDEQRLQSLIRLRPGDEGYYDVSDIKEVPGVTMVRNEHDAKIVLEQLQKADYASTGIIHACDTEVMDIDLSVVGPVGNGYVTCLSMYSGDTFDYGLGQGPGSCLWIDNLDDTCGILQLFKEWLEDARYLKVWHNYGFDRHVLFNEGIHVQGLAGDTMHMARLQNTARGGPSSGGGGSGYSLEALTKDLLGRGKLSMKKLFGVKRLRKDGSEGSLVDLPPVEVMQRSPQFRTRWIEYSCYDAQGCWLIHRQLRRLLQKTSWYNTEGVDYSLYDYYWAHMRPFAEVLTDMERRGIRVDAHDYLASVEKQAREDREMHSKRFREWAATKIGSDGLAINPASSVQLNTFLFGGAKNSKTKALTETERVFKVPREEIPENVLEAFRLRDEQEVKEQAGKPQEDFDYLLTMKLAQLKALCKEQGLKVAGTKAVLQERLQEHFLSQSQSVAKDESTNQGDSIESMTNEVLRDALISRGIDARADMSRKQLMDLYREDEEYIRQLKSDTLPADRDGYVALSRILEEAARNRGGVMAEVLNEQLLKSQQIPKFVDVRITSLGLDPEKYTVGGAPSVTADVIKKLAGDPFADPPRYGSAKERFGIEGCEALASLGAIGSIDTMIANFLTSLQELADSDSRVHCSLNLNTETGRLSSRRPNLQNQPALEKDKYKIRKAFQASPGNNLIVADYGQLELRILASMTNCKSMIDAFASGGDFHSRTAIDMFPYVREAIDKGECLLEWDYSKGDPPKPLLKDKFASERRKAKTLNFSIAYGKTAHGLSQDWGVDKQEAEKMLQAWYEARPEVRDWQANTKQIAYHEGITRTLMGRYRQLPHAQGPPKLRGHAERASINTPIQGGAADIAMMAMIKINNSEKLKELGWILLLQIHDEVILEGPEGTAEEAFKEVLQCMEEPWVFGLEKTAVPLVVDGSCNHKTWFDAK